MTLSSGPLLRVGRYELYEPFAAGGLARVHFGRLVGAGGFARVVAIKRLHPIYAEDPEFVAMLIDEARLASRIRHPNVVATLDVEGRDGELLVVMDYVPGESLARLSKATAESAGRMPIDVAVRIAIDLLEGLHAAHEAKNERGLPLQIVHRDVSPQNVIVGTDGVARVVDFGIAKAAVRLTTTREGQLKGKLRYMAPEQLLGGSIDRRVDVYAASVVLWEMLTGRMLFVGENDGALFGRVLEGVVEPPTRLVPELTGELEAVVMRGLDREPEKRPETARDLALALQSAQRPATHEDVAVWVARSIGDELESRAQRVRGIEAMTPIHANATPSGLAAPIRPLANASEPTLVAPAPSGPRLAIVAGVVLAAGGLAFAAVKVGGEKRIEPPPLASASNEAPAGEPKAPHEPSSAPGSASPEPASASPQEVAAPSTAGRPAASSRSPPSSIIVPKERPPKPDCNPPTMVDARGIRRVRPGCAKAD